MLANAIKLLFLAMALVCATATPDILIPDDEKAEELKVKAPPFIPKPLLPCPFDCNKVCVVKFPYTFGNPPISKYAYVCHIHVHRCCKNACDSYQKCLAYEPEWACYAQTLDYLCKCRSIVKIPFKG